MNKQDKELLDKIKSASDNVSLPEELSRDNIVKQLDGVKQIAVVEAQGQKTVKDGGGINKKRIISAAVSVAAAIAIVIGIGAVGLGSRTPKVKNGSPDGSNVNINNNYNSPIDRTGYGDIEAIVADYYKKQLSERKKSEYVNMFSLFGTKKGTTASDTGSAAPSKAESVNESAQVFAESSSYGKTNLQVDGVDEGDIVKTDGKNIYVCSNNRIYILDVSDEKNIKTLNSFPAYVNKDDSTDSYVEEMYLSNGRLITVVSVFDNRDELYSDRCSYSCAVRRGNTVISVYNITNPKSPVMEFSYTSDGSYVSSRLIGDKFIYVGQYDIPFGYYENNEETSIEDLKETCVPTEIINGIERKRINAGNICVRDTDNPTIYQTVASFNINDCENTFYSGASLGGGGDVYCDGEYLFVSSDDYFEKEESIQGVDSYSSTKITAYRIDNNALTNIGSVTLPGSVIGQFSMDRYNGYFRVAVDAMYKNKSASYVFIINDKLEIVSRTEAFGLGENMKSVRFAGDTAYAVTFRQTDPLFVIDLSDVKNPKVVGELKIPGFSKYLHPVGDNLVLGIGEGGDENGTDGSAEIKLFDVSDPKNPKCVDTFNMKNTDINDDHRAFVSLGNGRYGVIIEQYDDVYVNVSRVKALVVDINDSKISKTEYFTAPVNDDLYRTRATYIGDNLFVIGDSGVISYSLTTSERLGTYIYYDN